MKTRLHKVLSVFLVAVMLITAAPLSGFVGLDLNLDWLNFTTKANAATSGSCGSGVTWSYSGTTLTIGGKGTMYDYENSYDTPWDDYDSAIRKVIISNGVTIIGKNAFASLSFLTSVTITEGVTSIGEDAFAFCYRLTSITIPDSVTVIGSYAFDSCYALEDVKIGNNVETIGDYAFRGCKCIERIAIPGSVTSIGTSAFSGCNDRLILELEKDSYAETYAKDNQIPYCYLYNGTEEKIVSISVTSTLSFEINKETYTMTIYCSGDMPSFESDSVPWIPYEPYVRHVIINDGCTSICENAFYEFYGLEDVVIPDSVITIGDYAFYNCWNLTDNIISDGVTSIGNYAFYGCDNLVGIIITDGMTSIGDYAFYNCLSLANLQIPNGVTSVGNYSFYGCSSLTSVTINNKVTTVGNYSFYGCSAIADITIPDSVKTIGHYAFYDCSSLTSIAIPDSVTYIGLAVFRDCTSLTNIAVGNNVKSIESSALRGCTSLTDVTIPDSVTSMGEAVFKGCVGLKSITLSDNIENIGKSMFYECTGLTDIVLPDGVTSIGNYAFYGCSSLASIVIPDSVTSIGEETFYNCADLTNIIIPDNVTTIGSYAFYGCVGITSVTIPESLTTIGYHVFNGCSSLTSVTIPDSITTIGDYAFRNCTGLTSITIPGSVTAIGNYAFYGCSGLVTVYLPISVRLIGSNAFASCTKLEKLKVYNKNCNFESSCISNYTIICGYSGSTAETYANEKGYEFELITDGDHEHIYSNSCDSECNICGYVNLNAGHIYKTVVHNPTCQNEGFTVCICTVCKYAYISQITDTVDHDMRWVMVTKPTSSADGVKHYSCSYCGLIEDTKVVPAFLISENSVANIDFDSNTISGFDAGSTSVDDYVSVETDGYSFICDSAVISTGTVIELTDGETVISEFTAVVFGDLNGDGWYDGTDSIIVSCIANGMLTEDDVSVAAYEAADCNHDGVVDSFDVALLEKAGALLASVDQAKSTEELATDEAYIEYVELIDQSPEMEETAPEENIQQEQSQETQMSILDFIIELIKSIINMIIAYIPLPIK